MHCYQSSSIILDLHSHNLYPPEVCGMFELSAFKVMHVKLQLIEKIYSVSSICIDCCLKTMLD